MGGKIVKVLIVIIVFLAVAVLIGLCCNGCSHRLGTVCVYKI